jgi:hypothetical protein
MEKPVTKLLTCVYSLSEAPIHVPDSFVDSPELGSPPVAQFRDEESFSYVPEPLSVASPDEEEKEQEPLPEELSLNVETRRRRRDSGKMNAKRVMVFNSSPTMPAETEEPTNQSQEDQTSRTSRKRKLSDRLGERSEGERGEEQSWSNNSQEAFPFNVKAPNNIKVKQDAKSESKGPAKEERSSTLTSVATSERKALSNSMNPPS